MGYQRLALCDRYQIGILKKSGMSVCEIGRTLGRPTSTISRELRNNSGWMGYEARIAQSMSVEKRKCKRARARLIQGELREYVSAKLQMDWSPEQISGRLSQQKGASVSYSSIYRFVYRDARQGGELWQHLRTCRKKRKRQKSSKLRENFKSLKAVRPMSSRPPIVEKKKRIGDLERDLVCGTKQSAVILTINDRVSRRVKIGWMAKKSSRLVHQKTVKLLKGVKVLTLTNDNGSEFARHQQTEQKLKTKIYFSRPGCAWERGANENTNGLIRQYFPRSLAFESITPHQIRHAEERLNNRPRKCLGYRTPNEVHRKTGQVLR